MGEHSPPKCPYCKAELWEISVSEHITYTFNSDYNRYEVDGFERDVYCPDCNAWLSKVWPRLFINPPEWVSSHEV